MTRLAALVVSASLLGACYRDHRPAEPVAPPLAGHGGAPGRYEIRAEPIDGYTTGEPFELEEPAPGDEHIAYLDERDGGDDDRGHGTAIEASLGADERAICPGGGACEFSCPEGGCDILCAGGSACEADCDGGDCRMICAAGATCEFDCEGGDCRPICAAGSVCDAD